MTDKLSDAFWAAPDGTFQHEVTKALHAELIAFLRDEFQSRPGLGVVEMMMVERTALFYCYVRDRERSGIGHEGHTLSPAEVEKGMGFVHERNYKEATQLLTDMLSRLQRASSDTIDAAEIRSEAIDQVTKVMLAAIDTLPEDVQEQVRGRIADAFEGADL